MKKRLKLNNGKRRKNNFSLEYKFLFIALVIIALFSIFLLNLKEPTGAATLEIADSSINCMSVYNDTNLTQDLTSATTCFIIANSSLTLDCQGYYIKGTRTASTYGIYAYNANITNVTIKNCNISDFNDGIRFDDAENSTFFNNTVFNNTYNGITIRANSHNNNLTQNTAYNNTGNGFSLSTNCDNNWLHSNRAYNNRYDVDRSDFRIEDGSDNNTLINNSANYTHQCFSILTNSNNNLLIGNTGSVSEDVCLALQHVYNNTFINNTFYNSWRGVHLDNSTNNTFSNNTVYGNSQQGIYLTSNSNNNTFQNNTVYNNSMYGVELERAHNNTFFWNNVSNNSAFGFYIENSTNNNISYNYMQENGQDLDINPNSAGYCNNILLNNTGSGGREIYYFNRTFAGEIDNTAVSLLILCNADNSLISGVVVNGSDTLQNNGIYLYWTGNTTINNSRSSSNSRGAYLLYNSNNNTFINNTFSYNTRGIDSWDNFGNRYYNNTVFNSSTYSVYFLRANNSYLEGNNFTNSPTFGVYLDTKSNNNTFTNNSFLNSFGYGIFLIRNTALKLYNNTFFNSTSNSIYLYMVNDSYFEGNSINNTQSSGINLAGYDYNNTLLNNIVVNSKAYNVRSASPGLNSLVVKNATFGQINWTLERIFTNISLGIWTDVFIENNLIGLTESNQRLNLSGPAQIEFYGLSYSTTPKLLKDGVRCDDTDACNITYDATNGMLYANISSFSNYTTAETIPPVIVSSGAASVTAASATLEVSTDELATCKYNLADLSYESMSNTMSGSGTIYHYQILGGLSPSTNYVYYVICQDIYDNAQTSSTRISFTTSSSGSSSSSSGGSAGGGASGTTNLPSEAAPVMSNTVFPIESQEEQLLLEGEVHKTEDKVEEPILPDETNKVVLEKEALAGKASSFGVYKTIISHILFWIILLMIVVFTAIKISSKLGKNGIQRKSK